MYMTVKNLIEVLKGFDQNSPIIVIDPEGQYHKLLESDFEEDIRDGELAVWVEL